MSQFGPLPVDPHQLSPEARVSIARQEVARICEHYGVMPIIAVQQIRPDFLQSEIRFVARADFQAPVESVSVISTDTIPDDAQPEVVQPVGLGSKRGKK